MPHHERQRVYVGIAFPNDNTHGHHTSQLQLIKKSPCMRHSFLSILFSFVFNSTIDDRPQTALAWSVVCGLPSLLLNKPCHILLLVIYERQCCHRCADHFIAQIHRQFCADAGAIDRDHAIGKILFDVRRVDGA